MGDPLSTVSAQVDALCDLNQPADALPSICRAVFGVSPASTTATLSSLYDLGRQYIAGGSSSTGGSSDAKAITCSAAAWTLLMDSQQSDLVLQQFVAGVFLPLAVDLGDTPAGQQQLQQLAELLAAKQAWQVALEVLLSAHNSLQAMLQQAGINNSSSSSRAAQEGGRKGELQPRMACAIIRQVVSAAVRAAAQQQQAQDPNTVLHSALQSVLQLAAGQLFCTALQLLRCPDSHMRQAAFQQLLPELLQAAAVGSPAQHRACPDQLLQQCLDMVATPVVPRRMGLAVLLQYWSDWHLDPPATAETPSCDTSSPSQRFWPLLRECLVDAEPLNRKRALRLLQLLLPKSQLQAEPLWGVLISLYELLDEFTPHLVKATWPMVSHLHRPAAAYAAEDAAADVATSKRLNVLSRGQQAGQQPGAGSLEQQVPMAFCWSSIIWTQALQHSNLQVQRMALKTLLKRDWSAQWLQQVPVSFLTQVLLPALVSPLHYNTQQAKVSNCGAVLEQPGSTFDVRAHASQLLGDYVVCAGPAAARALFTGGLQTAAAVGQELSRSGLQAVLQALAAAAGRLQQHEQSVMQGLTQEQAEAYGEASLRQLQLVLTRFMAWHGSAFKATCCTFIANIAAAVAPAGTCSLPACMRLAQEVPLWMLGPGGPVNPAFRAWLAGSSSSRSWLVQAADSMWQHCLGASSAARLQNGVGAQGGLPAQQQQQQHATASDYAMWRVAADAWLRAVLCCGEELQQSLVAAVSELAALADQIMSRPYLPVGLPDRVLIMTAELLDMAEVARRVACQPHSSQGAAAVAVHDGNQQLPWLTQAAVQFAAGHGGAALVRLLQVQCSCYRSDPRELAGSASTAAAAGQRADPGLCPAAWQAAARAESTAQAAAAAVVLLAHAAAAAAAEQGSSGAAPAAGLSVQQVLRPLLGLLQQMAEAGQAIAAKPLPCVSVDEAAGEDRLAWAQAAAAAEVSRASAVLALRHLSQGISRALACLPRQHWPAAALPLQPPTWIEALLRESAAAADAARHWEPVLTAGGATGDVSAAWLKGMDWPCLDACMALTGLLSSTATQPTPNRQLGQHAAPAACSGAAAAGSAPDVCGPERLPGGVLAQGALLAVLVEALEALQWTPDEMLHLLRCLRRVWALAVRDSSLQDAALEALAAAGLDGPTASDASSAGRLAHLAASLSRSLLQTLKGNKKRPVLLCGSLVNTLLLPELLLFDPQQQPQLVALHAGPAAPLRQFAAGALQSKAGGSSTLHLVLGLRLGAAIPAASQLLGWYSDELRQLVLFSGPTEEGLEPKASQGAEAATEWSLLAEPLEPQVATAGVIAGMGPRIAVVVALHQLATAAGLVPGSASDPQQPQQPQQQQQPSTSCADSFASRAVAAGVGLWRTWMQAVQQDPVLSAENFRHGSDAHRGKVRMWQALSAAAAFLGCRSQREAATQAVQDLLVALESVNPASVKQYQEASLTYLLLKHQTLLQTLLLPQLDDLEKGSAATASHILVAVQAALHSSSQDELLPVLLKLLLPWTNHHTHNIRTFAQLGVCALLEAQPLETWPGWQQGLGQGGVGVVAALAKFYDGNADFQRFRRSMGVGMRAWRPGSAVTPAGIFCSSLSLAGAEEAAAAVTFEGCRQSLMDTVMHFLAEERAKLREAAADRTAAEAEAGLGAGTGGDGAGSGSGAGGGELQLQLDYQRKVTPSERAVLLADVLDDAYAAAEGVAGPAGTRRHELIVVASLINKVPNLGGLARTAEVLGAGTLVLSDLRQANDSLFTSISVTAERWVPMLEVKEAELLGWLKKQKAAGYSLVGLEQTAESTSLPSFSFPTKTVLVLGREKEGVPPEIIALLDATVEIPQLGVIRSLNVHVSGAIAMYEYTKQRLGGQAAAA